QRAIRVAMVNILKALDPTLKTEPEVLSLPRGALDLGEGYSLRRAKDTAAHPVVAVEMAAIQEYAHKHGLDVRNDFKVNVTRWARVGLPNGQIARSRWKEELKPLNQIRMARKVE
ncbi:hypothetical protein V5O48_019612, partial [Marasmius crinis-equi]